MLLSTDIFDRPEQTHIPWEDFADTPNIDFQALKKSITAAAGAKVTEQLVDASLALVFETAGRAFSSASLDSLTFLEDGDSHSYAMGLPVDDLLLEFDQNGQLIKSESEERPAFIQSDYYNGGEFLSWEDDLFPVFAPQAAAAKGAAVASPNFPLSPQFSAEAEDSDDSSSDSDSDDSSDSSDAESVRPVATKKSVLTSGPKRSRSDGVLNEKRSSAAISRPAPKSSSTSNISNAKTSSLSTSSSSSSSSSSSTSSNNAKSKTTPDIKRRRRTSAKNASSPNGKSLRPMTPPEQSVIEIVTEITTVSQSPLLRSCPTPKKGKIGLLSAATHDLSAETIRTIFQTEQVVTLTKATAGEEEEEEEIDIL